MAIQSEDFQTMIRDMRASQEAIRGLLSAKDTGELLGKMAEAMVAQQGALVAIAEYLATKEQADDSAAD
jgi:hypothetical protein